MCASIQLRTSDCVCLKTYIAVKQTGEVIGLLMMEEIAPTQVRYISSTHELSQIETTTADLSSDGSNSSDPPPPPPPPPHCSRKTSPNIGVRVIWVHDQYRRQEWGRHLLDCARSDYLFGAVIDKQQLAFSQPTSAGLQFAKKYVGSSPRSLSSAPEKKKPLPSAKDSDDREGGSEGASTCSVPCYV